jgi:hypothetical protein
MARGNILNSIADQASAIRDWLGEWAVPMGGTAVVAFNYSDLWGQAAQSSQKPIIIICYMGESARGGFDIANATCRVDRSWAVMVKRGRGFASTRGDTLTETKAVDPFYSHVEAVRDLLRRMLGISMELPTIDFKGIRPASQGGMIMDAYLIEFTTANDIPMILTESDDTPTS